MDPNKPSERNEAFLQEVNGNESSSDKDDNCNTESSLSTPMNDDPFENSAVNKFSNCATSIKGRILSEGSEDEDVKKQKASTQPTGFFLPGVAASPPKFVSLDQIMKAAKAVSNMSLAHEIVVNKDFKFETSNLSDDSFKKQIKDIVHKAFWDVLQSQLEEDPPVYTNALSLLSEIKETLLSMLLPHQTTLQLEINEILDIDLIKQQVEKETLDFHYYAQYIISVMSKMCAPVRDDEIRELMQIREIVPLFQGIFKTMDLMNLDLANFHIQLIRPQLVEHTIEYERKKFAEYMKIQDEDGLECTRAWLQRSVNRLKKKECEMAGTSQSSSPITVACILTEAYVELLQWDDNMIYPETLLMDQCRFMELCKRVDFISLTAAVLLVTYSTVGASIAGISQFKEQLKNHLMILLEGIEKTDLTETMKNVAVQVTKEVNDCLIKHGFLDLSAEKEGILQGQIEEVSEPEHKIRQLVKTRILEFVEQCLSSLTTSPVRIPPGLSSMQAELSCLTGQFLRLVSHNRAVFGEYYAEIIDSVHKVDIQKNSDTGKCERESMDHANL